MIEAINEDNNLFKFFLMEYPYYLMKIMVVWMTFYGLENASTRRDFIDSSETKEINQFTYRYPFGIHFRYSHQFENHNNQIHAPI